VIVLEAPLLNSCWLPESFNGENQKCDFQGGVCFGPITVDKNLAKPEMGFFDTVLVP